MATRLAENQASNPKRENEQSETYNDKDMARDGEVTNQEMRPQSSDQYECLLS